MLHVHYVLVGGGAHSPQGLSLMEISHYCSCQLEQTSSSIIMVKEEIMENYEQPFHCFYLGVTHVPLLTTFWPELVCKGRWEIEWRKWSLREHYRIFNSRGVGEGRKIIFLEWIPDLLEFLGQKKETYMNFWKLLCRVFYRKMCFLHGDW